MKSPTRDYVVTLTTVDAGGDTHARSWNIGEENFNILAEHLTTYLGPSGYEILADADTAQRVHEEQTKNAIKIYER